MNEPTVYFVFLVQGRLMVLTGDQAKLMHKDAESYRHTATIQAQGWIEALLNHPNPLEFIKEAQGHE